MTLSPLNLILNFTVTVMPEPELYRKNLDTIRQWRILKLINSLKPSTSPAPNKTPMSYFLFFLFDFFAILFLARLAFFFLFFCALNGEPPFPAGCSFSWKQANQER